VIKRCCCASALAGYIRQATRTHIAYVVPAAAARG
jgi:hypothetical protein